MKLILTNKELIALGDCFLKSYHIAGATMTQMGEDVGYENLAKTDKELLKEGATDFIHYIESNGGTVEELYESYIVEFPENMTIEYAKLSAEATEEMMPFILKCYNFGKKYSKLILKVVNYAKSMARYICTSPEAKKASKELDELVVEGLELETKIIERFSARG